MLYPITDEMKYDKTVKHTNTCKREQFNFLTDEEFEKLRLSEMEYSDEMCDEVKRFFALKSNEMTEDKSTNRLVLIGKGYVYKLPLSEQGRLANQAEYDNYLSHPDVCAYTEKHYWGLKQEQLTNIKIFPLEATEDDVPDELKTLWKQKLNNRFQVGQNKNGEWKFFDYEDVKYYEPKG